MPQTRGLLSPRAGFELICDLGQLWRKGTHTPFIGHFATGRGKTKVSARILPTRAPDGTFFRHAKRCRRHVQTNDFLLYVREFAEHAPWLQTLEVKARTVRESGSRGIVL